MWPIFDAAQSRDFRKVSFQNLSPTVFACNVLGLKVYSFFSLLWINNDNRPFLLFYTSLLPELVYFGSIYCTSSIISFVLVCLNFFCGF